MKALRRPWFETRPIDDGRFFDEAPVRLVARLAIARPAEAVWADLTGEGTLDWCRILDAITWTSERPFGVGTTREVRALRGAVGFRERYFRWEEGRRKSFTVLQATAPLARAFAEDYLVEPAADGRPSCVFTWTIAYEPSAAGRPGEPVNRRLLSSLFKDTRKHYDATWLR
ncbi:MAG TPA: SRPBCC family protein [Baekduia sp.]|uniref:SRPBCC family protein n=1 Tax=Baekduia sp. TaxID=2600305 RepID=UPI002D7694DD|nr:SRPBCC family protein [Baekduia sp.]HET6507616.1 SRPBCC family protein [Baekduia sp.]